MKNLETRLTEIEKRADAATVIQHVRWSQEYRTALIYPSADTDMFHSLLKQNRGTLIFIPAEKDYGAKRGDEKPARTDIPFLVSALREAMSALKRECFCSRQSTCHACDTLTRLEQMAKERG